MPLNAVTGETFARFRISSAGGLIETGAAADGEVEDYALTILSQPPTAVQGGTLALTPVLPVIALAAALLVTTLVIYAVLRRMRS